VPRALFEQVVVLTGASSGVGRETALQLAEDGGTVVAAARNAEALTAEVERLGGTITTVRPTSPGGSRYRSSRSARSRSTGEPTPG
jgi:NAD(P)-dependent dehydrogenase (short-subunit alcohol dehydrogenase family)